MTNSYDGYDDEIHGDPIDERESPPQESEPEEADVYEECGFDSLEEAHGER